MIGSIRIAAQIALLTAIFAAVAVFADWPRYRQIEAQSAIVKLSFTHGSNRKAECRKRTAEELAKLPPNMRNPLECPRKRGAVYVELDLDGALPKDKILANLNALPASTRAELLQRGLNEFLFFVLFVAGDAIDGKEWQELRERVARALEGLPRPHAEVSTSVP